ncbi:MAG: hypothetical protein LBR22_08360 [Desulfovibrio sp.]|jgi:hypothetical protein|nr:hypothetical protein [Desulfovibrio sp.]
MKTLLAFIVAFTFVCGVFAQAAQSAKPVSFAGPYEYAEKPDVGTLVAEPFYYNSQEYFFLQIETEHVAQMPTTCSWAGICVPDENRLVCHSLPEPDGSDHPIVATYANGYLNVDVKFDQMGWCGLNASLVGRYRKTK